MGLRECVIALFASTMMSCGPLYIPTIPQEIQGSQVHIQVNRFMRRAQTRCEDGECTISYAESWIRSLPEEGQMFVFLHESAHIRLNHMGRTVYDSDERIEIDADCLAGEMLRDDYGYDRQRLMIVHDVIRDQFRYFPRRPEAFRECMGL